MGLAIETRRRASGITAAALSEAAEIDERQMARILTGRSGVSFYSLGRVAAALLCTPEEIVAESLGPRRRARAA